jgi:ferrochelatase
MRLENIVALTHATLLNDPYVSEFSSIVFDATKVKRGDLYVAFETDEISLALANGAYAVLFQKPTQILDSEVAWLKVEDLENALLRLLRFRFVEKEIEAFCCDPLVLELSLGIDTFSKVIPLYGDFQTLIQQVWDIEHGAKVLFSEKFTDANLFTKIFELSHIHKHTIEVVEKTLFEVSFIFDNTYYEQVPLSPFFIPHLEKLLNFYKTHEIPFRLKKFTHVNHFEIVFTNNAFDVKEHGSSELVLFFEKDLELLEEEMAYLEKELHWAKVLYILPRSFQSERVAHYYENPCDIFAVLENNKFHYAFIGGIGKEMLELERTCKQPKQLTFDI